MNLFIGQIVQHKVSDYDATWIRDNRKRKYGNEFQFNSANPGDVFPLMICRIWDNEFGFGKPGVNGQLFLDGEDTFWITSRGEGPSQGQFSIPQSTETSFSPAQTAGPVA